MRGLAVFIAAFALLLAAPARAETAAAIAEAAIIQTRSAVVYDPSYRAIPYPMGDVPADRGVCSDVVIRAFRAVGIDLQRLVHEDMKAHFARYPQRWGMKRPDRNIDHRRVPNLETFFTRAGARIAPPVALADFREGDVVTWNLRGDAGYLPHIGIVTGLRSAADRPLVVHNIGAGPQLEDVLFNWKLTGHFRVAPHVERLRGS